MRGPESTSGARMPRRSGFTLIEVVLAVGLSALVLVSARLLIERLGESAADIAFAARAADREANGERLLRSLVGNIEVGTDDGRTFGGDRHEARFTTWCATPAGWQERCVVRLSTEEAGGAYALVAHLPGERLTTLRTSSRPIELRYLSSARDGGTWLAGWDDGLAAPRAIGLVVDSDIVVVRIGDRG
jgi:prepilin-type N-terminal cleavage/methylation domain-containing protein